MLKRITRIGWVRRVLCGIGYIYIHLVYLTSRWHHENTEHAEALWRRDQPFIIAFWHGRLMMMPFIWRRGVPINMLISQHADGDLVNLTMQNFGVGNVRGSTNRGGGAALRALVRLIERGESVGFTPDGPRGPRMRAAEGVVAVARLSGVPVLPASVATTRCRILDSWDRFQLALPFGRGVFLWGNPIHVPPEARGSALEAARLAVETALNDLTLEADRRSGVGPVTPAEPGPSVGTTALVPEPAQPARQRP
tara:strand:- start:154 stop:909 length:756 start_codon:yes stop_codon:yes gene_type:complete